MLKNLIWVVVLLATAAAHADQLSDRVAAVYANRACSGCHHGQTAREAMAYFTTEGGDREILKSLAYRHYQMRARVVAAWGVPMLQNLRYLEHPSIPGLEKTAAGTWRVNEPSFQSFLMNLTRDGDGYSEQDEATLRLWFQKGAPLPKDVMDEVYEEIRVYVEAIQRHR